MNLKGSKGFSDLLLSLFPSIYPITVHKIKRADWQSKSGKNAIREGKRELFFHTSKRRRSLDLSNSVKMLGRILKR
jgi:hypothetical protein